MLKRAFGLLAFLTLLSRFSGFVRVAVFASFFGTGPEADIFLTALLIPELMYRFLSEGLVSSAAIPIFVRWRDRPAELQSAFWSIFWTVTVVAGLGVGLLVVFAEPVCSLLVPGFSQADIHRLAHLWRIITPYLLLAMQTAAMTAFLNALNVFARPGLGPLIVNGAIIAGIALTNGGNLEAIAVSVTAGALLQLAWLAWLIRGHGLVIDQAFARPALNWPIIREFTEHVAPIAIWIFLTPIVPVYERYLLSSQAMGSVSVLNYNEKLINLPLGIISISLATVLFPSMSQAQEERRSGLLSGGLWSLVVMLVPVFLVMQAGSETIVEVVYRRGRFNLAEAGLTAEFLRNYSWFLLPASLNLVLNRAFFARENFRLPFVAGILTILLQIALDTWLVPHWGPASVGWGAALAATFQMGLLVAALALTVGKQILPHSLLPALGGTIAGVVLARPAMLALGEVTRWVGAEGKWQDLVVLGIGWAVLQGIAALLALTIWRQQAEKATGA